MRRNRSLAVPASLAAIATVGALVVTSCTDSSSDTPNKSSNSPTSKPTSRSTASPAQTASPKRYDVRRTPFVSSFDIEARNGVAYRVTFRHGELVKPKANMAAASQPSDAPIGNNLGTPLGSACKVDPNANRAYPFTISVTGLKNVNTLAMVKFLPYTTVAGTHAAAPTGSVRMELTQSNNTQICRQLNSANPGLPNPKSASYIRFENTLKGQTRTLTGWIILNGHASLPKYNLAITSISPFDGGTATKHKGEFDPFRIERPALGGGELPLIPNGLTGEK